MTSRVALKLIDIGANLTDPMFRGIYNGSRKHHDDFKEMLKRATDNGVEKMIITGGSLTDSAAALELAQEYREFYSTVGCHPTRCKEFIDHHGGPNEYLRELKNLASNNRGKVVALGELGLDYDRLHFCPKEIQMKYFEEQLHLAEELKLPLFLHNRNSIDDFITILQRNSNKFREAGGVVHSFDGTPEDLKRILDLGFYIGINGCSLKTENSLEVIKLIPSDRLMIETDCPWCEIRATHASHTFVKSFLQKSKNATNPELAVKNRNEPMNLIQVLEVIASVREEEVETLSKQIYENTNKLFFNK